ncbi:MAG: glycerol kinase GlpK [Chloroflexota bacterium]|nr:glycerol kinase GlpK [Chloroflexota bacterium]
MSEASLILALDQGTTSSRAVVFDSAGAIRGLAQVPTTQDFPHPGWVNQDPNEIWETTKIVAREAVTRAGIEAEQIAAIGIANQRETTILWDRTSGEPIGPAIVWQSRQSAPNVEQLVSRGLANQIQRITGLVPDAYFSATKIVWCFEQDPELLRRAAGGDIAFGTVDSWLIWRLSQGTAHVTDPSNAARTMLYDIRAGAWSDELLTALNIPAAILPEVRSNVRLICDVGPALLGTPLPVMGVAGDQQAALFGQACYQPGQAKNTYGTGSFLLMNTGSEPMASPHQLLTTVAWDVGGQTVFALEGAIFNTGSAVQWLRDGLGIIDTAAAVESLAASVPDAGGVVFVPALTGLGAPHWDPHARGTIVGITRGTTAAHIARATLEAIAFQTRDVAEAMQRDSGIALHELRVDGGAAANDLLLQIQADLLGVAVVRPQTIETTALGAAYLAGLGAGVWRDQAEVADRWRVDRRFEPAMPQQESDERYARWLEAVERSRGWHR